MTFVSMFVMIPTYSRLERIICGEDVSPWKKPEVYYGIVTILLVANITMRDRIASRVL